MLDIQLELIKSATIPATTPIQWMTRAASDAALCRRLALPLSQNRILVANLESKDAKFFELPVFPNAEIVAVHPASKRTAVFSKQGLEIRDANDSILIKTNFFSSRGTLRALAFDASGNVLYISFEKAAQKNRIAHDLLAFNSNDLVEIASATVYADREAGHFISIHPHEPLVAFYVGCGQDGTWSQLFKLDSNSLVLLTSIQLDEDCAPLILFSGDGRNFITLSNSRLQLWDARETTLLTEVQAEEGHCFGWSMGYWNNRLMVLLDKDNEGTLLQLRSLPDLNLIGETEIQLPEHAGNFEIIGNGYLYRKIVTRKKRISPVDCIPESETFQIFRIIPSE